MAKYRNKPVVIDAFRWTGGKDQEEDPVWIIDAIQSGVVRIVKYGSIIGHAKSGFKPDSLKMEIKTLEGVMTANPGDYIIQGVQGEIYPCKPDIFEASYEKE